MDAADEVNSAAPEEEYSGHAVSDAAEPKLTALKKAYADIILSISKEAAARVMASERKSVRYQHELKVAKEEGVRMLMRLKQMMDSQISEAEVESLNQQKKIEELEAQLQEAEDIVRDLREELGEVQAELERLKTENSYRLHEPGDACSEEAPVENIIYSYQSCKYLPPNQSSVAFDVTLPHLSQSNECCKCYNKIGCTCGAYIGNRDLPSIIVRGKDPGLYRNGCTQRIRACERNVLDRDMCLSEETDEVEDEKNCGELKEGKHTSKAPASGAKILSELEKKLLADINLSTFKSFSQKRKRAVRQRKTVLLLGGKQSHPSPKLDQLPEHSVTSDPISVNDNAHSAENPSEIGPPLSQYKAAELQTQLWLAKASENERNVMEIDGAKTMHEDEGESETVVPLRGVTGSSEGLLSPDCKMDVEKVDVPSHGLESNSTGTTKGLTSQPVRERVIKYTFQRKRKRQALGGSEVNGSHVTKKQTGDGQNGDQKLEQPKPSLLKESSGDCRRCGSEVNGSCVTEKKTGDGQNGDQKLEQLKPSLLEESSGDLRQCRSKVNGSEETEKKTGDGQNGDQKLEQPKASLLKESSRDRRRLAQVARQLISLSEKKWWN